MDTLELIAPTLDDARAQAAAQLGVDPSQITLTVLEEKKGLFGRPGSLRVKAEAAAPAAEKPAKARGSKAKAAAPAPEPEPAPAAEAAPEPAAEEPAAEEAPKPKGRGRKKEAPAALEAAGDTPAAPAAEAAAPAEQADRVATEEDGATMVGFFNDIFQEGDLRIKASVVNLTGKYINIELDGRDVSWLVGKRGEVLNALQYIGNVIASRQLNNGCRVVVDGNHFRERRTEILTKQATDIAEQVKANGMEAVLDPLPAFERRIVHQALAEYPGVVTYSEGEEPARRVVIAPAE